VAPSNTSLTDLHPYISPAFRRMATASRGAPLAPAAETFEAVALFADMSGFSALTARLSARGLQGAETLSDILNARFGRLVDLVHQYGGAVLNFAGDAAVAYWPVHGDASGAARRAVACAHAISEVVTASNHGGIDFYLRVGVGAGPVLSALVGGVDGRWHTLMGGAAWTDMLEAVSAARPGEVILPPSVKRLLTPAAQSALGSTDAEEPPALSADLLRAGVPRSVQKRLDAGLQGWLAEFRTVSTVFVNVPGLRYDSTDRLDDLQRVVSTMQAVVHQFGGSVNDLLVDDKGTVLLAAWGIPLHAYEDNPVRATLAGMALRDELRALGITPSIGITTGRAFAGPVGNAQRMRYALLGEPIIMAARLMQAAADEVLCDVNTRTAARARVRFGPAAAVRVAGHGEIGAAAVAIDAVDTRVRPSREMVGRDAEARTLGMAFAAVERDHESRIVIVRGEPGIGKSTLMSAFLDRTMGSSMRVLVGAAESMSARVPYHAWRVVFDALGIPLADLATAGPETSAEATRDLLTAKFREARGDVPLAVILEDAHWMDSASWSLAAEIQRTAERLLLVIVTRPMADSDISEDCRRLLTHPNAIVMDLDLLGRGEALALACRRLDVDTLPAAVGDVIADVAEGHPLFTEQLVRSLLERGVIRVEDHQCRAQLDLALPEFPSTVEGLIRSRIDVLSPEEQLTLKVASVFGRIVNVAALMDVHPMQRVDSIEQQLRNMARLGLLETGDDDHAVPEQVMFKHGLIQEVAYGTLPFEQRRRLHHAAAEWYERAAGDALEVVPLLARHWSEAGIVTKSLMYLEQAGAQALRTGNYRETVAFLSQAIKAADSAGRELVPPVREGTWRRQLGRAEHALGHLGEARSQLERAADLLGNPIPKSRARVIGAIARGALSPWLSRLRLGPLLDPKTDAQAASIYEAATALDIVSEIYYLNDDTLHTAYCIARRYELLSRLVPTDLFVRSSAEIAFLWEFSGVRRQADRLFEQGWALANQLQLPLTSARILYSWSIFGLGRGDWTNVSNRSRASAMIYRQHGENRLRRDSEFIEAYCGTFDGSWKPALALYDRLLAESRQQDALLHIAWAYVGASKLRRRLGRVHDTLGWIDEGIDVARKCGDRLSVLALTGVRALMRVDTGEFEGAAVDLRAAAPLLGTRSAAVTTPDACAAVAEAALALAIRQPSKETDDIAAAACVALSRSVRTFPSARPVALLWGGVLQAQRGRRTRALRSWRHALAAAEKFALPFEEGLIRLELGKATAGTEREAHLLRARELFQRLGAARELQRVDEAATSATARRS